MEANTVERSNVSSCHRRRHFPFIPFSNLRVPFFDWNPRQLFLTDHILFTGSFDRGFQNLGRCRRLRNSGDSLRYIATIAFWSLDIIILMLNENSHLAAIFLTIRTYTCTIFSRLISRYRQDPIVEWMSLNNILLATYRFNQRSYCVRY